MKNFKIKSYCKINLSLKIIKKLKNGYHNISSLITFSDLHDVIRISKIKKPKDKITFSGKFCNNINKKSNTITSVLKTLREKELIKNQSFKINVKKNIPHGSGLGAASSNASYLLNYFNNKMRIKLKKNEMVVLAKKRSQDHILLVDLHVLQERLVKQKLVKRQDLKQSSGLLQLQVDEGERREHNVDTSNNNIVGIR